LDPLDIRYSPTGQTAEREREPQGLRLGFAFLRRVNEPPCAGPVPPRHGGGRLMMAWVRYPLGTARASTTATTGSEAAELTVLQLAVNLKR
jgi:hypothetical protein